MSHDYPDDFSDVEELFKLINDDHQCAALYNYYVDALKDIPDPVTPELDAKMYKMFDELRKQERRAHRKKTVRKAAAVIAFAVGIGCITATQTEAWKAAITQLKITFGGSDDQAPSADLSQIPGGTPIPVPPEGYSVSAVTSDGVTTEIIYRNRDAEITFSACAEADEGKHDGTETVDINGAVGTVIKSGDAYGLVWSADGFTFALSGNVDINVLLTVARSVK